MSLTSKILLDWNQMINDRLYSRIASTYLIPGSILFDSCKFTQVGAVKKLVEINEVYL